MIQLFGHVFPVGTFDFNLQIPSPSTKAPRVATVVRQRIERGGERIWQFEDFRDLPFEPVAQALSRLAREGLIERLSKGIYYRTRETKLGKSRPNPSAIRKLASGRAFVFPSGIAAANILGFTTQAGSQLELATTANSLPRKLIGDQTRVHIRRPHAWSSLSETDAALLDFIRKGGVFSELPPEETVQRTLELVGGKGRYDRLLRVAETEPPRIRAILGAIGQQLGKKPSTLERMHASLNPLSRFDFGLFAGLPYAHLWQAKDRHPNEAA